VTAQGRAFLKAMTKSDEARYKELLQEEQLRRTLAPYTEIVTKCVVCGGAIQWSLVEGNPELHAYATGTATDPLAPIVIFVMDVNKEDKMLAALYATKKQLKEAVGQELLYKETSVFGNNEYKSNEKMTVVGPDEFTRAWFASVTMENDKIKAVR
jgi:hypothetical protein